MGTWGIGPFDNDVASDLLGGLREGAFSFDDLHSLVGENGYLGLDCGQAVVALATVVRGVDGETTPPDPAINLSRFVDQLSAARRTWLFEQLNRALSPKMSELYEVWEEAGKLEAWLASSSPSNER